MTARVARPGYTLAAMESGVPGGPPVVLSNSLGTSMQMWEGLRATLGQTRRVIGYDTRGHGASDAPEGPYDFDGLVADALAVMDHFGVEKADFIGLSLGGMTGMGLGLTAPERIARLVVCAARADNPPPFVASWDDRMAAIAAGGMTAIWPGTLERWLTEAYQAAHPDQVAALQAEFLKTSVAGYTGCAQALKTLDYLRHLGGMTVPTLYVAGAEDMAAAPAAMEAMAAATPGAQYVSVPEAGHIINVDNAPAFDAAVTAFLEG